MTNPGPSAPFPRSESFSAAMGLCLAVCMMLADWRRGERRLKERQMRRRGNDDNDDNALESDIKDLPPSTFTYNFCRPGTGLKMKQKTCFAPL